MSNSYLHIDSTYRNRNLWPKPGEFEIPIQQTGIENKDNSIDPVSLSEPLIYWSANCLFSFFFGGGQYISFISFVEGYIEPPHALFTGDVFGPIASSSDGTSFTIIITSTNPKAVLQTNNNYFVGLIFNDTSQHPNTFSRISSYKYIGKADNTVIGLTTYYNFRVFITVSDVITKFSYRDNFKIYDPTDFIIDDYPLLFVPNGRGVSNAYSNYILYNEQLNDYRNITFYDNINRIISCEPWPELKKLTGGSTAFSGNVTNFSIRKNPPILPLRNSQFMMYVYKYSTINTILVQDQKTPYPEIDGYNGFSKIKDYYVNDFVRIIPNRQTLLFNGIYSQNLKSQSRKIISYTYYQTGYPVFPYGSYVKIDVYPPFDNNTFFYFVDGGNSNSLYGAEIEPFSYDNYNPFIYSGTLLQQASCYEFELVNITLPNFTLSAGFGSKIAFYPYIYVVLSNVSSSSSHLKNIIKSNNPNSTDVIFRIPIDDVQDPETTPFVRLVSANMIQTIKFKPNDNLYFSVLLPNGDIFNTLLPEYYSPAVPNPFNQVSALFRYKRVI